MAAPKEIRDNYEEVMPGVYAGVPNDLYHSVDGLSKTTICELAKSVSHYKMHKAMEHKPTAAMQKGSAFHDLTLLPDVYKHDYRVSPVHTKTSKAWKAFAKENPGLTILAPRDADDVHHMRDALYDNPGMKPYLSSKTILREVCMWAYDSDTNLLLKQRSDLIANGWLIDLKSTSGGVGPYGFKQSCWKFDYHVQGPLYTDVATLVGLRIKGFLFFVVGSKPPFLTAIYKLNEDMEHEGRCKYKQALIDYAEYKTSNDPWDGLPLGREVVEL